jgi:hypothetical protein
MAPRRQRQPFSLDVARQIRFEAAARREGMRFERQTKDGLLIYRFPIEVPVSYDERRVSATIGDTVPRQAHVTIDGPICRRHRFTDYSLCMWWGADTDDARWRIADGLLALVGHVRLHAWCEADCRAGRRWPKEEAPGAHRRPRDCPTCHGKGE